MVRSRGPGAGGEVILQRPQSLCARSSALCRCSSPAPAHPAAFVLRPFSLHSSPRSWVACHLPALCPGGVPGLCFGCAECHPRVLLLRWGAAAPSSCLYAFWVPGLAPRARHLQVWHLPCLSLLSPSPDCAGSALGLSSCSSRRA